MLKTAQNELELRKERESPSGAGRWLRPALFLLFLAAVIVAGRSLDLGQALEDLQTWIRGFGSLGPLVFVLVYVAAVVAAVPGVALTVLAGALFGSVLGVAVVSVGATLGASLAFLMGRYLMRETIAGWLGDKPLFQRLDHLTEVHGATVVALTRLVPLFPFNVLNYGFGLTKVSFATFLFWSWLCMLPATILFVVGTDTVVQAVSGGTVPWRLVAIVAVTAILVAVLVHYARRRLRDDEQRSGGE